MRIYHLESTLWLPHRLAVVFDFFADPRNLELLTPPWLRFRILTPAPITMRAGTQIVYRIRLHGISIRWTSEISVWEPPYRFVDVQRRGPYQRWEHEHRFVEHQGGTLVTDHVTYGAPGGRLVHRFLVGPDLRRIFAYRRAKLAEIFGVGAPPKPPRHLAQLLRPEPLFRPSEP